MSPGRISSSTAVPTRAPTDRARRVGGGTRRARRFFCARIHLIHSPVRPRAVPLRGEPHECPERRAHGADSIERPETLPPAVLHRRRLAGRGRQIDHRGEQSRRRRPARHCAQNGRGGNAPRDRGRQRGFPRLARQDRQGARDHPAPLVRADDGQPGRPGAADDRGTGQAAGRGARRNRLCRLVHRVVRRGGQARLRRHHSADTRRTSASSC